MLAVFSREILQVGPYTRELQLSSACHRNLDLGVDEVRA
jgi:hypothetical protein